MSTELAVGFDDLGVLTEDGVEVFTLNMNESPEVPPYYVDIAGRRFAYSSQSFLIKGHSATLPAFVRQHEADGHRVILVERNNRYMAYIHDPAAETDDEE